MTDYKRVQLDGSAPATGSVVEKEELRLCLTASTAIAATSDAGFSDDAELVPSTNHHNQIAPVHPKADLKRAAVLVLLVNHRHRDGNGPQVLFTQRTAHLTDHGGQISFPGGRVEDTDRDATHTALRETEEETGIDGSRIEMIGTLPHYTTGTGYLITPVVGWIESPVGSPVIYSPDPTEVAECFEVPFQFLINPDNHRLESAMYKGRMRSYYAVPYLSSGQRRYIWGATAGMIVTLTRVIAHARGETYLPAVARAPDSGE